jgi:predicted RecA/RadA family phage recombinase
MGYSHIHLFAPGANVTCDTSADIIGGRLVEITGNRTVAHAAANSIKVFGAAATDTKSGDDVLVIRKGVQRLLSSAAIPAGSRIVAAADGKVAAAGNGVTGIGLALTTTTATDQLIQVALD